MDTFFGTADSYSHFLGELGHEAHEVIVNGEAIQRAWAREHAVRVAGRGPAETILLAQAEDFRPDVVYVQNPNVVGRGVLRRLRSRAKVLAAQIASEPPSARLLRSYDIVLSSLPNLVERIGSLGVRAEYFRIGFDERVLERLDDPAERDGTVFVGALDRRRHRSNAVLVRAADQVPVDFWGYGLRGWPRRSVVRRNYRGQAWGLDMYRILRGAKVALNRHISTAGPYANNMRLYEATGVGTLLLTDEKSNLGELFEPGREVVTYTDSDDLAEKIRHYVDHENEREEIARAGQERTLRDHTYRQRMSELAAVLETILD
jgi:spore maturation protein CgeB